ncbi:DUF1932 domain-containing protein [Caldibacillus thermoamylovorans]
MTASSIGFIGFGEAAFAMSCGLLEEKKITSIFAYDINSDHPLYGAVIRERAEVLGVPLTASLKELCENTTHLFCTASAKVAEKIAENIRPFLHTDHYYIDMNAVSPMTMERVAARIAETGASFVDAAVMDTVPQKKHKVPIYVSGLKAHHFAEEANGWGMNITFIGKKPGSSSAIKMFRSIFMKGFSTLLLETLHASRIYGVEETVLSSLEESITARPLQQTADLLLPRTAIHAERRVAEMREVIATLGMLGIDATMSEAVAAKLQWLVDQRIREQWSGHPPQRYDALLAMLKEKKLREDEKL